ncbi:MAG: DUF2510 domain-containing protein [Actinomycetes bacterium]
METTNAGWYPDPYVPGYLRWWDGTAWSERVSPIAASPDLSTPVGVQLAPEPTPTDPAADLAEEQKYGNWARGALFAGAAAYAVYFFFIALPYGAFLRDLMNGSLQNSYSYRSRYSYQPDLTKMLGFEAGILLFQAVLLGVGILFILWLFRAATIGKRAGLPAKWQPVWAIVSFIIPVLNFFVPYMCARDSLPANHPARASVKWWWGCYLAMSFMIIPVMVAALFSPWVSAGFALIGAVVAVVAALAARRMITEVTRAHAEMLNS